MSAIVRSGLAALAAFIVSATAAMANCQNGLGVARIVEIDATAGPVFGMITKQSREERFLGPKEVVLTFDDGPMPGVTRPILDTLDRYCTKATFFAVGKMAIAYPDQIREILKRGHTLGTHTWSHPMSLPRLKGDKARDQIESGFAAVAMAAGQPIAPFFRFPGLNDSPSLIAHLESRNIATFTVDVVSNDSYISDPARLIERTLQQLDAEKGGIMLFHDIKPQTARALPTILAEIKARGYRVVHLRSKVPFVPDQVYAEAVRSHVAAKNPGAIRQLIAITEIDAPPAPAKSVVPASAVAPSVATSPSSAPVASAPEMAAADLERPSSRRQAPLAALTDTSSWAAVVAEPKANQQALAKPVAAAAPDTAAEAKATAPTGAERAQPQNMAQASSDWPEVRRNGRVIRVEQPRQIVSEPAATEAKPAATPATPAPEKAATKPETKSAPAVLSAPPVVTPPAAAKAATEPKPVAASTPSTPQKPRIINAPDASDVAPPTTAAAAVTPADKTTKGPETLTKPVGAALGTEKSGTAAKIEAAVTAEPAIQLSPANAANVPAAVLPAAQATQPSPGGAGIEVLAGSYAAPAASAAAAPPSDPAVTAGRFAAPEIIAGTYRQQPATSPSPVSEPRRADGSKQKRAP